MSILLVNKEETNRHFSKKTTINVSEQGKALVYITKTHLDKVKYATLSKTQKIDNLSEFIRHFANKQYNIVVKNWTQVLKEILPHGSGINYDWYIEEISENGTLSEIQCSNKFDIMNENGYYNGVVDFTVKINIKNGKIADFTIDMETQDDVNLMLLRDYLYDLFADIFDSLQ